MSKQIFFDKENIYKITNILNYSENSLTQLPNPPIVLESGDTKTTQVLQKSVYLQTQLVRNSLQILQNLTQEIYTAQEIYTELELWLNEYSKSSK